MRVMTSKRILWATSEMGFCSDFRNLRHIFWCDMVMYHLVKNFFYFRVMEITVASFNNRHWDHSERWFFLKMVMWVHLHPMYSFYPGMITFLHGSVESTLSTIKPRWSFATAPRSGIWRKWGQVTFKASSQEIIKFPPDCLLGLRTLESWAAL